MSDVTVAPNATPGPAAAPSAPAPSSSEVVINQNPPSSQNAVPPQAPPAEAQHDTKPAGRPESNREAIRRAIAKQRAENPPQPREAKRGDNNPPEETPDEKFNLKKRPSDQTAKIDQPRDRGRFAARPAPEAQPGVAAERQAARPGQQAAPQAYVPPPPGSPAHHHPLPRMSERAMVDWAKTPDTVRADVHRMYREVGQAFQKYKSAHDYMQTIEPYVRMAREQGTSLDRVLANHVAIEEKLRTDPIGALDVIVHNLNLQTPDGNKLGLRDLAWHVLNQTPEQQQLVQRRNETQALRLQIEQMRAEHQALVNDQRRMQYAQHFQTTRGAVDRYADQRPRFDELGAEILREVQLGFDLDTAYRRAELLRPATAAQTRTQTSAQTRTPDRSISGAPGGGPVGANGARGGKPVSIREALTRSINHHRGAL